MLGQVKAAKHNTHTFQADMSEDEGEPQDEEWPESESEAADSDEEVLRDYNESIKQAVRGGASQQPLLEPLQLLRQRGSSMFSWIYFLIHSSSVPGGSAEGGSGLASGSVSCIDIES